jgi:two-component system response regulator YesN
VFFAVKKSIEILDVAEFRQCMKDFFSLPEGVLSRLETRIFLREVREFIFQTAKNFIPREIENMEAEIQFALHVQNTFNKYKQTYIEKLCEIIEKCAGCSRRELSKEVRQAVVYVQDNYGMPIFIDDVALKVRLSANYFSMRFKKEMGESFTSYLIAYRMMVAKRMLRNSSLNISEIANAVSYDDVRYFGRLFKRYVNITPSEYRRLLG